MVFVKVTENCCMTVNYAFFSRNLQSAREKVSQPKEGVNPEAQATLTEHLVKVFHNNVGIIISFHHPVNLLKKI